MHPFGAVEAGGTKVVCAVGTGPDDLADVEVIPTTTPEETLGRVVGYFEGRRLGAIGVGSFGPLDLDPASPTWGSITATPKPGWSGTDLVGPLRRALGVPVAIDTDVNAAALAEGRWGAARGLRSFVYLTVGTGIGGGAVVGGRLLHGRTHPEVGHMLIPRDPADAFEGVCPFHGACLEGLASGPALQARWGRPCADLEADHPAWPLQARTLARGLVNLVVTVSPERVVLGGGVMRQGHLFPLVREAVREATAGYVDLPDLDGFIVPPGLGDRAGVLGAVVLAETAAA